MISWFVYYLFLYCSCIAVVSLLAIVFLTLLRIVVDQKYPPMTRAYFSTEIVEFGCLCFVLLTVPLGWIQETIRQRKTYVYIDEKAVQGLDIIIIPGYEMNRFASMFLQKYLQQRGHRVWAINNRFFANGLDEIIDATEYQIFDILRQNEIQGPIHLIGHSMGGIISCEISRRNIDKIASVITLGTPFAGTKIHMLGIKKHVLDLSENSSFCDKQRQIDVPHLCFWSPFDSIILPSSNAYLSHLNNQEVNVGHLSFLFSTVVFQHIYEFYKNMMKECSRE